MKNVDHTQLEVGMSVVMTKASPSFPGLVDRLFTVTAIDPPYVVLRTGRGGAATNHMIKAAEAEFALPDKETVAAMLPESALDAEYLGEE